MLDVSKFCSVIIKPVLLGSGACTFRWGACTLPNSDYLVALTSPSKGREAHYTGAAFGTQSTRIE